MGLIQKDLSNLQDLFPNTFTKEQVSACKTLFLKKLAIKAHARFKGKMQTIPKVPVNGYNWYKVAIITPSKLHR